MHKYNTKQKVQKRNTHTRHKYKVKITTEKHTPSRVTRNYVPASYILVRTTWFIFSTLDPEVSSHTVHTFCSIHVCLSVCMCMFVCPPVCVSVCLCLCLCVCAYEKFAECRVFWAVSVGQSLEKVVAPRTLLGPSLDAAYPPSLLALPSGPPALRRLPCLAKGDR